MLHAARQLPSWLIFDVGRYSLLWEMRGPGTELRAISRSGPGAAIQSPWHRSSVLSRRRGASERCSEIRPWLSQSLHSGEAENLHRRRPLVQDTTKSISMPPFPPNQTAQQGARANAGICHAACYRRIPEMKRQDVFCSVASGAPAPSVAHL